MIEHGDIWTKITNLKNWNFLVPDYSN